MYTFWKLSVLSSSGKWISIHWRICFIFIFKSCISCCNWP